jgi:menaquinone-dependent protoporphyrinogen oxidase
MSTDKILVTYASRTGTTVGVAKAIGQTLRESGGTVDVIAMNDVTDITPYHAVVAGSAIQGGEWLPEAMRFVKVHQVQLLERPCAIFLVCMTLAVKNEKWRQDVDVSDWLTPVRKLIKPVSEGHFAGALHINTIPSFSDRLKFRISVLSGIWSEGDHRDWNAIRAWANALPVKLGVNAF